MSCRVWIFEELVMLTNDLFTGQVRPRRGPGHHVQALDGAGDADQARWQSWTGSRSLSACQQV